MDWYMWIPLGVVVLFWIEWKLRLPLIVMPTLRGILGREDPKVDLGVFLIGLIATILVVIALGIYWGIRFFT